MELVEKGDLSVDVAAGKLLIVVGQDGKIRNTTEVPLGYLIDKLEEVIPGDQKQLAGMLKGALGI